MLNDEQVAVIGEGAKRFPVKATVNGYTWRGSVARMGGENLLGLSRAGRAPVWPLSRSDQCVRVRVEVLRFPRWPAGHAILVPPSPEAAVAGRPPR